MAHDGGCGYECGAGLAQNGGPPHVGGGTPLIDGTTGAFSTVTGRHGGKALQISLTATRGWLWHGSFSSSSIQIMGFAMYVATNSATDIWGPCFLDPSPTPRRVAGMFWDGDTQQWFAAYGAVDNTSMSFASTGFTFTSNEWHWISIRLDNSGATANVDITVDGVAMTSLTGATKAGTTGYIYCPMIQNDIQYSAPTLDWRFDDFVHSVTNADYPLQETWVKGFWPKADGTHSTGTGAFKAGTTAAPETTAITDATTTAYQSCDGPTIATTGTFINQTVAASGNYVALQMQSIADIDPNLGDPLWVEAYAAVSAAGTAGATQTLKWVSGSTVDAWLNQNITSTYGTGYSTLRPKHSFRSTAPDTGAWTKAKFDALRMQWGFSTDATPDIYLNNLMLEAAFVPPGKPRGNRDIYPMILPM